MPGPKIGQAEKWAKECDRRARILRSGKVLDEEYTEDPDEVSPCLICGEPKPNREACPTCRSF